MVSQHELLLIADALRGRGATEVHASQDAHARDCVRYTALTVAGWLALRFTWHQVMHSPAYVRSVLADVVERTDRRAMRPRGRLAPA